MPWWWRWSGFNGLLSVRRSLGRAGVFWSVLGRGECQKHLRNQGPIFRTMFSQYKDRLSRCGILTIKMRCRDTVLSNHGDPCTGKTASLYWVGPQVSNAAELRSTHRAAGPEDAYHLSSFARSFRFIAISNLNVWTKILFHSLPETLI